MINRQRSMTWLPYQSGSDNQVITVFNFKDRLYNNDNIGRDFRWLRQKRQKSSDVFSQSSRYSQWAQSPYDQSGTYSEDLKSGWVKIPNGWKIIWFANDLDFKCALKSGSQSIWNPRKWPPFDQKTFEIWTKIWMVWVFNGWECLGRM